MKICPYCGNKSGLVDRLGGCVTCGGQLEFVPIQPPLNTPIPNSWMTVAESRQEWMGVTGGYSFMSDIYAPSPCPPRKKEVDIREIVRRAVGLD